MTEGHRPLTVADPVPVSVLPSMEAASIEPATEPAPEIADPAPPEPASTISQASPAAPPQPKGGRLDRLFRRKRS